MARRAKALAVKSDNQVSCPRAHGGRSKPIPERHPLVPTCGS